MTKDRRGRRRDGDAVRRTTLVVTRRWGWGKFTALKVLRQCPLVLLAQSRNKVKRWLKQLEYFNYSPLSEGSSGALHYVTKYIIVTRWLVQISTKAIKQHFIHIRPNSIIPAPILVAIDLNELPNITTQTNNGSYPLLPFPVREWR